jgi:hypothetical protein
MTTEQLATLDKMIFPNGGSYLYGALAGQGRAKVRQAVMSYLTGEKVTQAKSGLTALLALLIERTGVQGECPATRERNLVNVLKGKE